MLDVGNPRLLYFLALDLVGCMLSNPKLCKSNIVE